MQHILEYEEYALFEKMKNAQVKEKVFNILAKVLKIDKSKITLDKKILTASVFSNSLTVVEIKMEIEDAFEIVISDDFDNMSTTYTVGDLIKYVQKQIK